MCTSLRIKSQSGLPYWGRTWDFATNYFDADGRIVYFSKQEPLIFSCGSVVSKFDILGMGIAGVTELCDGINEAGLAGGLLYFEEATVALPESLAKKSTKTELFLDQVVTYMLSQCASVEEVAYQASQIVMISGETNSKLYHFDDPNHFFPLHFVFTDESGKCVVLEPDENGELTIHENTLGTMANSPRFDWHLTNLRNYVNLSQFNIAELNERALHIKDIENGSGLLGLPGDYTSPSRFVRITFLSQMMETPTDDEALKSLYDVFATVMVPKGIEKSTPTNCDYTNYWIGYDIKKRAFELRPTKNRTFTSVSLDQMQKKYGAKTTYLPIDLKDTFHTI